MFRNALAASLMLSVAAGPAAALSTFDLSWTADPVEDPTIVSSDDATARALGTIIIDAGPGDVFGPADIVLAEVTLSAASLPTTTFLTSDFVDGAGSVAPDGRSATFVGAGSEEPFWFDVVSRYFFGCGGGDGCDPLTNPGQIYAGDAAVGVWVAYTSNDAALASLRLTASGSGAEVPLPATGVLMLAGIGGLAALRRRRRET